MQKYLKRKKNRNAGAATNQYTRMWCKLYLLTNFFGGEEEIDIEQIKKHPHFRSSVEQQHAAITEWLQCSGAKSGSAMTAPPAVIRTTVRE